MIDSKIKGEATGSVVLKPCHPGSCSSGSLMLNFTVKACFGSVPPRQDDIAPLDGIHSWF